MQIIKIRTVVILLILFTLLTPYQGVAMGKKPISYYKEKLTKVDFSDGINKEEAIIIAQNYLIDKGIDKDCVIDKPKVTEKQWWIPKGCWEVRFKASFEVKTKQGLEWFSVYVNKTTGKIKGKSWGPDL
jgi:hypothetical protein